MSLALVGPLGGMETEGVSIGLYAEQGYENRIHNCLDLYLTKAKSAVKSMPADAPNPCQVALDPPWDGPHVFAVIETK